MSIPDGYSVLEDKGDVLIVGMDISHIHKDCAEHIRFKSKWYKWGPLCAVQQGKYPDSIAICREYTKVPPEDMQAVNTFYKSRPFVQSAQMEHATKVVKPITPLEATTQAIAQIPWWVLEAVNELLTKNIGGQRSCIITQKDIIDLALSKAPSNTTKSALFQNRWLNFEQLYREQGWIVSYEAPTIGESFEATYSFTIKR